MRSNVTILSLVEYKPPPSTVTAPGTTVTEPVTVHWIDSLTGTYYGYTDRAEEYYDGSSVKKRNEYSGPDTVTVTKIDSATVEIYSSHIWRAGSIQFDTSRVMRSSRSVATLTVNQRYDSIGYYFSVSGVPPNTYCRFHGGKR